MIYEKFIIGFAFLTIASYTDIKRREADDYVSMLFFISAILLNLFLSIIKKNSEFIINSITGLIIGYIIASILYYTGFWGGGDSKYLINLYVLIGINPLILINSFHNPLLLIKSNMFLLFVYILLSGMIFTLFYIAYMLIKKHKKIKLIVKKHKRLRTILNALLINILLLILINLFNTANILQHDLTYLINIFFSLITITLIFIMLHIIFVKEQVLNYKKKPELMTPGELLTKPLYIKQNTTLLNNFLFTQKLFNDNKINKISILKKLLKEINKKISKKITLQDLKKILNTKTSQQLKSITQQLKLNTNYIKKTLNKNNIFFNKVLVLDQKELNWTQIKYLQKHYPKKEFIVKDGMPYLPSFLMGFILMHFQLLNLVIPLILLIK